MHQLVLVMLLKGDVIEANEEGWAYLLNGWMAGIEIRISVTQAYILPLRHA